MARKFLCPSCGGEIVFQTSIAPYAVCPYCKTMVVQNNDALQNLGVMAALPSDMSPFEIGTEGYFGKDHFGIVGRMKIGWNAGTWNEWFFFSDEGRKGWLAEAQGSYAACYDVSDALAAYQSVSLGKLGSDLDGVVKGTKGTGGNIRHLVGQRIDILGRHYAVTDIKEAECLGAEGELPISTPVGRKSVCVDLMDEEGGFASLDLTKEGMRVYTGMYISWKNLRCSRYRMFEGW